MFFINFYLTNTNTLHLIDNLFDAIEGFIYIILKHSVVKH